MLDGDAKLARDALAATVAVAAALAAIGPLTTCARASASLYESCRGLRSQVPDEYRRAVEPFVDPLCGALAEGHWGLFVAVVLNALCYLPSVANPQRWSISKRTLSHERLLRRAASAELEQTGPRDAAGPRDERAHATNGPTRRTNGPTRRRGPDADRPGTSSRTRISRTSLATC